MNIKIDVEGMVEFLVGLLNTPSPTGNAGAAIEYVQDAFAAFPFEMNITPKGLLIGTWAGEQTDAPRALTAHVDTLGAMVRQIKDNGRLRMTQLGGWAWASVEGEGVTIFSSKGATYRGAILPTAASAHAYRPDESDAKREEKNMEVRIDARTTSAAETEALGIRVGDFISFDPRVELSESGFIRSRHLDDKASVATIYGAIQAMLAAGVAPKQRTTIHISHYEEVGHGAATGFPADLAELVAIDMAVVAPNQETDEFSVGICAKDSGGPYHVELRRHLEALAEQAGLNYKTDIYPYYGSDGEAYWRAGGDVRLGLIGPGVDASHHYERTHREALEHTARLIVAYLLD
jgi:putative aminopeptidase FrvX